MSKCFQGAGKGYCWFSQLCNYLQSPLLLVIRLYWGWHFFLAGLSKWMDIETTAGFFANLNIPFPLLSTYLAASAELVGGLLLLVGLFSRFAALALVFTMIVAYATAHIDSVRNLVANPDGFFSQSAFLYLYASLIILAFGAGCFSLDALMQKICRKEK